MKSFWLNFLVVFVVGLSSLMGLTNVQSQVVAPFLAMSFCEPANTVFPCRKLAAGDCGGACANNSPGTVTCVCKLNVPGQPGGFCKCWAT